MIAKYADSPRLDTGRKIANRLQGYTDGKLKMGLLFLARGQEGKKLRLLTDCVKMAGDLEAKEELVSAARLAPNMDGQIVSIASLASRLSLSPTSQELQRNEIRSDTL